MMTRAAAYSVSPALVQKVLFASLALLLTLLAGQQYQRWHAQSEAPEAHHTAKTSEYGFYKATGNLLNTAALESTTALEVGKDNNNSIEQAVPVQVHQKSWIF